MSADAVGFVTAAATLAVVGAVIYAAFHAVFGGRGKVSAAGSRICTECGTRGEPRLRTKGSSVIELLAWLCFIIPGIFYSLWRVSSREKVCPACERPTMIPVDSPRGRALVQREA